MSWSFMSKVCQFDLEVKIFDGLHGINAIMLSHSLCMISMHNHELFQIFLTSLECAIYFEKRNGICFMEVYDYFAES